MPTKITTEIEDLMTPKEVAEALRVSVRALDQWRLEKPPRGPKWLKLGDGTTSPVRYRRRDVQTFLSRRSKTTR